MDQQPISFGRIKSRVETALGVSLPTNRALVAETDFLDALASRHPEEYLRILEHVVIAVEQPQYVGFSEATMSLTYYRLYYKEGFLVMGFTFLYSGFPRRWVLSSIRKHPTPEQKVVEIKTALPGRKKAKS